MRLNEFANTNNDGFGGALKPGGSKGPGDPKDPRKKGGPDDDDDEASFENALQHVQRSLIDRTGDHSYNYLSFDKSRYERAKKFWNKGSGEYMYIKDQKLPIYVEVDDVLHSLVYATKTKKWDPAQHVSKFDPDYDDEESFNDGISANVLAIAYLNGTAGIGYPPNWKR